MLSSLKSRRVLSLLLFNGFLHACPIYDILPITGNMTKYFYFRLYVGIGFGIIFLMFPFIGWVGEIVKQYRIILASMMMIFSGFCIGIICTGLWSFSYINFHNYLTPFTIAGALILIGFGMFEANSLRFSTDQIPDASSRQVSLFVRYYYWSTILGPAVLSSVGIIGIVLVCKFSDQQYKAYYQLAFGVFIIQCILVMVSLIIFIFTLKKQILEVHRYQVNPLIKLFQVLKYTWYHKYPERRSAFTYWETDIPARIDLGKNKYGGPFTNEEVEGVKSFFWILLLLVTLFGYQLAGDTYSLSQFIKQYGCPTMDSAILLAGINPQLIPYFVVLIVIPLQHIFCCHCQLSMLKKIKFGLFASFLQEVLSLGIGVVVGVVYEFKTMNFTGTSYPAKSYIQHNKDVISLFGCYAVKIANISQFNDISISQTGDALYWMIIVPQFLSGIAQVLVFMTALEFICAQAPHALQGILVGIWYASYFINFTLVGCLDTKIFKGTHWYIYHSMKVTAILLSLLLFCCVGKHYRYRERTEVVNERLMIEEIWERNLLKREEYSKQIKREK